jgi:hypothetical protein
MFVAVAGSPKLTDERLTSLYTAEDFGGSKTMRGRVIRELIDEIRDLRRSEPASADAQESPLEHPTD